MSRRPTRITIFNHKGGVGKTTLTANIAFALSSLGKSVLLVDSDPQCNLTSYLLSDDVVDDLLDRSNDPGGGTIWTAVKPVLDNTGVGRLVDPTMIGDVALLPGDIRLSGVRRVPRRRLGGQLQAPARRAARDVVNQGSRIPAARAAAVRRGLLRRRTQHRPLEQGSFARFGLLYRSGRMRFVFGARARHSGPDAQEVDHGRQDHPIHRAGRCDVVAKRTDVSGVHSATIQGLRPDDDARREIPSSGDQKASV